MGAQRVAGLPLPHLHVDADDVLVVARLVGGKLDRQLLADAGHKLSLLQRGKVDHRVNSGHAVEGFCCRGACCPCLTFFTYKRRKCLEAGGMMCVRMLVLPLLSRRCGWKGGGGGGLSSDDHAVEKKGHRVN